MGPEWAGHNADGWMEYKRSADGGRTWSEPQELGTLPGRVFDALMIKGTIPALIHHRADRVHVLYASGDGGRRLLVQASHAYDRSKTNALHWWLEWRVGRRRYSDIIGPHHAVGEVVRQREEA